jgi:hypothetical protein
VLGVADHLRGEFSAEGRYTSSHKGEAVSGQVLLHGLTYAAPELPPLQDIRGRLSLEGPRVGFTNVTARLFDVPVRLTGQTRGEALTLRLETDDIPLVVLPIPYEEDALRNLLGVVRVEMDISGDVYGPRVSGVATLIDVGFDYHGVEIREVAGQAEFDLRGIRFDSVHGYAGKCAFQLSGEFEVPQWRENAVGQLQSPACQLDELLRMGAAAGLGTVPGVQPEELDGSAALTVHFENLRWRTRLRIDGARWKPAWLPLPVGQIHADVDADVSGVKIHRLNGRMGESSASMQGHVDVLAEGPSSWEFAIEARLEPDDAKRLLHARTLQGLRFSEPITGYALLAGSSSIGTRVKARLQTLPGRNVGEGGSTEGPITESPRIELTGIWKQGTFQFDSLTATVGSAKVEGRGRVRLSPGRHVDLGLEVSPGSPVTDLLAFVRLPEALSTIKGTVAADVAVVGAPEDLDWSGTIDLEEVRIPALLTEPVALNGQLALGKDIIHVRDIQIVQPQGSFALSGAVRPHGESELRLTGAWANLDRLLGWLPETELAATGSDNLFAQFPFRATLTLERVQFLGLILNSVEGELRQTGGQLSLQVPDFAIASGRARAEIKTTAGQDRVRVNLELEEVPVEFLLVDLLKQPPTVRGPFSVQVDITGPLSRGKEFLMGAEGEVDFYFGQGRIQRGTLPERLFALAVMLREGLYGFSLIRLGRSLAKPRGLRRFSEWTGSIEVGGGKARLTDTYLVAKVYDVHMTGELDLHSGTFEVRGDGDFHPGWEFDISLKAMVGLLARLSRLARGRRGHAFEFDVEGQIGGRKRIRSFRFKD